MHFETYFQFKSEEILATLLFSILPFVTDQPQDSSGTGLSAAELPLSSPYLDLLTMDELQHFGVYIVLF